ncbi:phosphoribosylanthranilate isomerase [Thermanaerosceptrum fracticalcis]|nr:phosphoribosylanthranilate isomerase [Thermanaerosceptrum fracticalcis]
MLFWWERPWLPALIWALKYENWQAGELMVWIKICGITNLADAETATAFGANALGFVFAPSKRKVEPDTARQIIKALPPEVEKIGVFVNEEVARVKEIANYCGLTGLQLHGEESPDYCSYFRNYDVIKAFRVSNYIDWQSIKPYVVNQCINKILLDTYVPQQLGGTGKTFPWEIVGEQEWEVPVIIAGGLNAGNAALAVRLGKPFGVDVASGVEKEPGKKDPVKLKAFIEKARGLEK